MTVRAMLAKASTHRVLQSGFSMKCVGFGLVSKFINTISLLTGSCSIYQVNAIDILLVF
jgi:hypothetical protein